LALICEEVHEIAELQANAKLVVISSDTVKLNLINKILSINIFFLNPVCLTPSLFFGCKALK